MFPVVIKTELEIVSDQEESQYFETEPVELFEDESSSKREIEGKFNLLLQKSNLWKLSFYVNMHLLKLLIFNHCIKSYK